MGVLIARTLDRGTGPRSTAQTHRAAALFASTLQASEHPSAEQVRRAVATTLQRLGPAGCADRVAGEFGEHPELAANRMSWALATVGSDYLTADPVLTPALGALALAG
jgi:hypothetical protein